MPSRPITTAIIVFWLVMTGWLVYRQLAPRFQSGEPPPYTIDLTDEVSGNTVGWVVLQKDKEVGNGTTRITRHPDRTYEFVADFRLHDFKLLAFAFPKLKIAGSYRVSEEGSLNQAAAHLETDFPTRIEFDFRGEVRERQLHPQIKILVSGNDLTHFVPPPEPVAVAESGRILNPMHLVHKIDGLREGQTWMIPLMDPLKALPSALRGLAPGKDLTIDHVQAEVKTAALEWDRTENLCFKIEYRQPGDKMLAATWVRRRDGLVLQQWASYEGIEYTLRRSPGH